MSDTDVTCDEAREIVVANVLDHDEREVMFAFIDQASGGRLRASGFASRCTAKFWEVVNDAPDEAGVRSLQRHSPHDG